MDFDLFTADSVVALAQAASPQIDGPFIVRIVSRMIHILCAVILGGGIFYLRSVLSPAGADACFAGRRSVWARWVAAASFLLLASGLFNFFVIMGDYREAGSKLPMTYHILFGVKFLLGLFVMFVAAILAGKTSAADRFRQNMPRWLNMAWTAVIAIVVIGALLRAHHPPQANAAQPAIPPANAADGEVDNG